nr:protein SRG1-like [Ipomoea batatas]
MERNISPKFGSSLPVPCVQELAKESPEIIIPTRYVREDLEPLPLAVKQIPVINMANLLKGKSELRSLRRWILQAKNGVFFSFEKTLDRFLLQLINHGVSSSLVEKVKTETKHFYLPMEEKKKFWQKPGDLQGFGSAFVHSEDQKLDWCDLFYIITLPTYLRKPDLFPNLPLPFRETVEMYAEELRNLAMTLTDYLAKALGIEQEHIRGLFNEGLQAMRMNHYPRCPQPDKILSNGTYHSAEHRAVVNSKEERLSIATFFNPRLDAELGPAPTLITPQNPAKFRTVGVEDYFKGLFAGRLERKAYIEVMRIQNGR